MATRKKKMPSWTKVKGNFDETQTRKAIARKYKDMYRKLCENRGIPFYSCISDELVNTVVNLSHQKYGDINIKPLLIVLVRNDYITDLNMCDNSLTDDGAIGIADMLSANCAITKLNLAENRIHSEGLQALEEALTENPLVTSLDLSGNKFGDAGAEVVSKIIGARTGLTELMLGYNEISEDGANSIAETLGDNDTIKYLNLKWNSIRGKGSVSLAHSLKGNETLVTLDLSWNGYDWVGAKAMGEALKENNTLRELDLSHNRINDRALIYLTMGLQTNTSLKVLKLNKNPISSKVVSHLMKVLESNENSGITHLELESICVDEEFSDILERLRQTRTMHVKHGLLAMKKAEGSTSEPVVPPRDPLDMLFEFKYERGYRTMDLLTHMDKDGDMTIDKKELKLGLMGMDVEISEDQLDDIIDRLDTNKDGSVDYSELAAGEKQYISRHKRHMKNSTLEKISSLAATMMRAKLTAVKAVNDMAAAAKGKNSSSQDTQEPKKGKALIKKALALHKEKTVV